jgi:hypothetical protein
MIFYPFGGGFASAGMIIFGPMSGLVLGPWAGAVAGLIGGLIGMFISPGSYPLGLIDVVLSGVLLPVFWGLAKPYYRKFYIPFTLLWIVYYFLTPFYFPGQAADFGAVRQPMYTLSFIWGPLGLIFVILMQRPVEWMKSKHRSLARLHPLHGWTNLCLVAPGSGLLLGAYTRTNCRIEQLGSLVLLHPADFRGHRYRRHAAHPGT